MAYGRGVDAVRPPAVAGSFYPAASAALQAEVDDLLGAASPPATSLEPKVLIVPHAGYVYSGPVAATAYRVLGTERLPRRFVLVGPSHFVRFRGAALPQAARFSTPLGEVAVDAASVRSARDLPGVSVAARAHEGEHSLEVQLPFLQTIVPGCSILPLLTGDDDPTAASAALDVLVGEGACGIISSDLSHYLDAESARRRDRATARAIVELRPGDLSWHDACGRTAVQAALKVAARRGWECRLLDLRNSADTVGPPDRVVGYGAFVLGPAIG
jgi:AmmeMemoRadiSam system protein B